MVVPAGGVITVVNDKEQPCEQRLERYRGMDESVTGTEAQKRKEKRE